MKYIIEDGSFTFSVDFDKQTKVEDGFEEEYFPSCQESIDAFMRLLTNIYPPAKIADTLADGIDAMDYSLKGREARQKLMG